MCFFLSFCCLCVVTKCFTCMRCIMRWHSASKKASTVQSGGSTGATSIRSLVLPKRTTSPSLSVHTAVCGVGVLCPEERATIHTMWLQRHAVDSCTIAAVEVRKVPCACFPLQHAVAFAHCLILDVQFARFRAADCDLAARWSVLAARRWSFKCYERQQVGRAGCHPQCV